MMKPDICLNKIRLYIHKDRYVRIYKFYLNNSILYLLNHI